MPTYLELHRPREETVSVSASTDVHSGDYVCDGTNDQVEINAALTYVSGLGGGSVVCLQGAYALAATVNVPANCTLRGVGWSTVFNYDAGGNCVTITGDNAKVRDLKIDIVAGAGAAGSRPNCVFADTRTNLELFGLWLIGDETVADDASNVRQNGIVLNTVTYSRILDCTSQDHVRYGIYLTASCDNSISGNTCDGNTGRGIRLDNSSDSNVVSDNVSSRHAQYGMYLEASSHNVVSGNIFNTNTQHGMRLQAASQNSVLGNICSGNGQHGLALTASDDNVLSGNSCNGNDADDTGTYDGINLSGSDGNLISENTCKDNDRWGIMVDADSDFNKVSMNYTSGNTSGSIRVNNANCDKNQLEFNTVEEGAPGNVGTATRSYGNYDPSADAFVGDVGAAPF